MGGKLSLPSLQDQIHDSILELKQEIAPEGDKLRSFAARNEEWARLVNALAGEPSRVTLIIGPKDSGKSCLLSYLKQKWNSGCQIRTIFAPFVLINMHECCHECDSDWQEKGLAFSIRSEVSTWASLAMDALDESSNEQIAGVPIASIRENLQLFSEKLHKDSYGLHSLLQLLQITLLENRYARPIFVLDEAQVLKSPSYYTKKFDDIKSVYQFFSWLCKYQGMGHVIMASSAPFFWSWASDTMNTRLLKLIAIGYFHEADAQNFFRTHLLPKYDGSLPEGSLSDDVWNTVYEVTGGSPYLLKAVASDAVELGSWKDATQAMVSSISQDLRHTFLNLSPKCDMTYLEGIIGAIVDSGGHVAFDKVIDYVFAGDELTAREKIEMLAEKNVIHTRLWTQGLKYMDVADRQEDDSLFTMAADPAHYAAMKELYLAWFATVQLTTGKKKNEYRWD